MTDDRIKFTAEFSMADLIEAGSLAFTIKSLAPAPTPEPLPPNPPAPKEPQA